MSERLRRFTKAVYGFDAVVRRVDPARWDDPSPCEDWTARDLVQHQVDVMNMVATGAGGEPGVAAEDDPVSRWAAARDAVLAALDTQGALQTETDTPFGRMPVDRLVGILAVDPLAHTWDLAMAAGLEPVLDPDLCERGAAQLEKAGDLIRGPGLYGPAIEVARDADPVTRFVAVAGRTPR
jgi:uncharacterized protein (TIGR03086 family)